VDTAAENNREVMVGAQRRVAMTQTTHNNTAVLETIREAMNHAGAGTVFGTPIHQNGVTVVPAARISGGSGGGSGTGPEVDERQRGGIGGGLGLSAKPLGAFVIKDGRVSWRPAIDVNKVIVGGQIVAIVGLLVIRSILRRCRRPEPAAVD
jgi:uncharacterized spore protein YtfJ